MNIQYNTFMIAAFVLILGVYLFDTFWLRSPAGGKNAGKRLSELSNRKNRIELIIFLVSAAILLLLNNGKHIVYNNYSYLADSLLHGHLDTPDIPSYLESVEFGGHVYMHFAPGPAILSLPFVAIRGVDGFNPAYLCIALGAANSVLFYKIITNMNIGETLRDRLWFTAFAVFGIVHLFLADVAHSWFFGHVSTWFFLLFAMYFITVEKPKNQRINYILSGLFFGLAVTCRLSNLFSAIFFIGYILIYKPDKLKAVIYFGCGAVVPGALYMLFNFVRFGTVLDKSYNLTHLKDKYRTMYDQMQTLPTKSEQLAFLNEAEKKVGGPLQLKHIPHNLYSIFCMMPEFTAEYPYVIPLVTGVSITFLSPALYFMVTAPWKQRITWVLAATMVVSAVPFLMNYGNGMSQFGMRYAMDFLPYMILLACMGMKRVNSIKTLLISYCIMANMWGPIYWRFFYLK